VPRIWLGPTTAVAEKARYITTAPATLDARFTMTLCAATVADVSGLAWNDIALDTYRAKTTARLVLVDATELPRTRRVKEPGLYWRVSGVAISKLNWMLAAAPVAIAAEWLHAPPLAVFGLSALAILPLSALLGEATEELAARTGPTIGGLLNATLGNLAELIIAGFALRAGLVDLVKASITGSILGNLLLVLGAAQLAGGLRYKTQFFNRQLATVNVPLLVIAATGLVVPALFLAAHPDPRRVATVRMSEFVAVLLIVGYALSLVYSMWSHRAMFAEAVEGHARPATWSMPRTLLVLLGVGAAIAVMSELLVGATADATKAMGFSQFFVGIILVPIIGNAAEHSSAVFMAYRNRMDLAVNIALGSSVQVALLVAPLLVFFGLIIGQPMDLAFTAFEVVAVVLAVWIASTIVLDAESNWLEGAYLLVVYAMLAVTFYFF
jgi:Ca2+:H+ antiporter